MKVQKSAIFENKYVKDVRSLSLYREIYRCCA